MRLLKGEGNDPEGVHSKVSEPRSGERVYFQKLPGRQSVELHSLFQLDAYQLSKGLHSQNTCFKGSHWSVYAASASQITSEFRVVALNEGSVLREHFKKSVGVFLGGGCQNDWESVLTFRAWEPRMAYNVRLAL